MKKNILICAILLLSIALIAQPAMASSQQSEAWLIDSDGNRTTFKMIETGNDVDLGRVRLRESGFTVDKLKTGDKLALILSNATFAQTPLVLEPPATEGNRLGRSGNFALIRVANTGRPGDNAVLYELQRKTFFDPEHRNLDYVFHIQSARIENEGDVYLHLLAGTQDDLLVEEIIKPQSLLLAKAYHVIPDSIQRTSLVDYERISREVNEVFETGNIYSYTTPLIRLDFPRNFFVMGDMVGFLNDERWTFRLEVNDVNGLRVLNPELSDPIGAPIREILAYKKDGFGGFSEVLIERQFQPVKVTYRNLNLSSTETSKFIPVRYISQPDGTYKKEVVGSGSYDHLTRSYSFTITAPGIYSVEKRDTTLISMRLNDFFATTNTIQNRLDVPPQLINGVTYVPIRFLAESLGAQVEFLQGANGSNQVEIKTADKTILLPINQITAELPTPARIIDGRTLVPVRFVSEQLGATVNYFVDTRRIEVIK